MAGVPEFILRKLYVPGSLRALPGGFEFALNNTFAPATVTGMRLEVDGRPVPPENLTLRAGEGASLRAAAITPQAPAPLSVGVCYTLQVEGMPLGQGRLTIFLDTREAGPLKFTLQPKAGRKSQAMWAGWRWPRWFSQPLKAEVRVDGEAIIGPINAYVYGHFVEHLERCVYGGLWTEDGAHWRDDVLALVKDLRPPLIRYPGGNFASGYHWEDGIGPRPARPRRFDSAWQTWETNQVGTDEFLAYCAEVGAAPFLVVNDGSGTPAEAARWVAYCNEPETGEQGRRRAANGHPAPYAVRLWGVGNEVWGCWQIGHTGPAEYAMRLRAFAAAMRAADPTIQIVGVGAKVLTDAPGDEGRQWNETVLGEAGEALDYLSFHLYQPDQEGWQEAYDAEQLHYTVCAAPLDAEAILRRLAAQCAPFRNLRLAFDEWNLWLAPPPGAGSMHQVTYTLRDAVYTAGMLNVFHRQCRAVSIANLAQLVNVLPAIVTDERRAYATPLYHAFWLYQHMQPLALAPAVTVAAFESEALGNIAAQRGVPYLDVTATRDEAGQRLTLGLVNRHPRRQVQAAVAWRGLASLKPARAWQLAGPDPLAANTFEAPEQVKVREVETPARRGDAWQLSLPPASVTVVTFGR